VTWRPIDWHVLLFIQRGRWPCTHQVIDEHIESDAFETFGINIAAMY